MATVTVTVQTVSTELPVGVSAGVLRIELLQDGNVVDAQEVDGVTATFNDVAEGFYTVTAQRLDDAGGALSGVVSTDFDVTGTSAETYDAPASLSVSVTP